jgi:integrase
MSIMPAPVPISQPSLLEPSFATAIDAIGKAANLSPSLRRHWVCSLRQIAQALGRPIETMPARWTAVRIPISALHHAMAGSREKTLQNHKSNVRRALVWFAGEHEVPTRGVPLRSEWASLRQGICERGDAARLSGLMRYCSGRGILPAAVTETVLDGYMAYRAATTRLATNDAARRSIARSWNRCVRLVKGWPSDALAEPPIKGADGPHWSDFPAKLRDDIEIYLAGLSRLRRSPNGKRRRPCKPSSIRTRRAELVAIVKTAADIVPMAELTDLRALLQPDLVERVLESYWQKDGERPGRFTIDLAWKLCSIARDVGVDAASLKLLGDIQAELETYRQSGLTSKNLTLIRQVLSPNVWSSVVNLPWALLRKARLLGEHAPVKAAVTAQIAVAIAILSVAPVRLGNLGSIRLGENLIRPGGRESPYWLVFPDYDVKNHIPLEFALDQRVTDLIDSYIDDYRPSLVRGSNEPWLFPGEGRGRKTLATLGTQITERIQDATGVRMTAHQFRHAAAAILLKHRPGEYELVRRLLGHRNIETTKNFYCGLETTQATEIYGDIIRRQLAFESEEC